MIYNRSFIASKFTLFYLLLACVSVAKAQTLNTGLITVNPNTEFSVVNAFENTKNASLMNNGDAYFYSDVTNDGMLDYTSSSSISFSGNDYQEISDKKTVYAHKCWVNNTADLKHGINSIGTLDVESQVDFTEVIVSTLENGALLNSKSKATTVNTNDTSFVDEDGVTFNLDLDVNILTTLTVTANDKGTAGDTFIVSHIYLTPY